MVDHLLGVVDVLALGALHIEPLDPLCAHRHQHRVKAGALDVFEVQVACLTHRYIAAVVNVLRLENTREHFAQAGLHFVLVMKDAVLGQATGSNVPVENDHLTAQLCQLFG